jgi:hypothetical protein
MSLSTRLVDRYKSAYEFPSEGARKKYLHDHPKADPKNHTVQKGDAKAKPEEDGKEKPEHKDDPHGEKPKGKGEKGNFFKGLSEKAKAFVTKSSAAVQKLVSDEDHRAKVMTEAGKTILASPKTYAKRLVQTAKEEVHEFKEAGGALKHLAQGKKLDHHQKKALKTVAIHMGIAVTAAALTSTGVFAGAAALGKGMVQKIALKAAAHALEKVHLVQEITHIGHGAHELLHLIASEDEDDGETRKVEKIDPEEAFAILIMQSVIKTMNELDNQDMTDILEEASGEQEKQAFKVGAMLAVDTTEYLIDCLALFGRIDAWMTRFSSVLMAARTESEGLDGRVWQTRFVQYFKDGEETLEKIRDMYQALGDMYVEKPALAQVVDQARQALLIPQKAEISQAISDIDFQPDPHTGRDGITYDIDTLKAWASALGAWSNKSQQALRQLGAKAKRLT